MHPTLLRLAGLASLLLLGSANARAQVTTNVVFTLTETLSYLQTNLNPPVLVPPANSPFDVLTTSVDDEKSYAMQNVSLATPASFDTGPFFNLGGGTFFFSDQGDTNLETFVYPPGLYTATFQYLYAGKSSSDTTQAVVSLTGDLYPTIPVFINATDAPPYLSAQGTLAQPATEDVVLAWQPFQNGAASDHAGLSIFDVVNGGLAIFQTTVSATNPAPRAVIPAGTLAPDRTYQAQLVFDRANNERFTTNKVPGVNAYLGILTHSSYARGTALLFPTTRAVRLRNASPAGGNTFRFQFRSLASHSYQVLFSTNLTSWFPLLTTNAAGTNVIVQQPATNTGRFFRVLSL